LSSAPLKSMRRNCCLNHDRILLGVRALQFIFGMTVVGLGGAMASFNFEAFTFSRGEFRLYGPGPALNISAGAVSVVSVVALVWSTRRRFLRPVVSGAIELLNCLFFCSCFLYWMIGYGVGQNDADHFCNRKHYLCQLPDAAAAFDLILWILWMVTFIYAIIQICCRSRSSPGSRRTSHGVEKTKREGDLVTREDSESTAEHPQCVHRCLICGRVVPAYELPQPDREWSPVRREGGTAISASLLQLGDEERSRMQLLSLRVTFLLFVAIRFRIVTRRIYNSLTRVEAVLEDGPLETPRM